MAQILIVFGWEKHGDNPHMDKENMQTTCMSIPDQNLSPRPFCFATV